VNQNVGSYEVLRVLARGGMAVVYLARQPALDRDVALKRLQLDSDDPTLAQRFVREARLAAALDHPNVVTLFDFFEDDGTAYIAMEYVRGGSLRPLVGRLTPPQVFGVLEGILAGLAHAETHAIAHRDLKPENVLITRGGGVKIADFGIARAYNALTSSLTGPDAAIGTPSYMAPEQVLHEPLGPYTDVYAVGVIAYELLAGRPPFEPDGAPLAVLYCHVHKSPPPLRQLAPHVPRDVCEWVDWLLAKPAADRPASAAAAWTALEEIAVSDLGPYWRRTAAVTPEPGSVPTLVLEDDDSSPPKPTTKTSHRGRPRAALVAAAVAAAGAAGAAAYVAFDSDPRPLPRAAKAAKAAPHGDAVPYDFDGDGRSELVLGMAESGADTAGVVLIRHGDGSREVVRPADAGVAPPYDGDERFGRSIASGDFNGDGRADLAASAPGRDLVTVIAGTARGLKGGAVDRVHAGGVRIEGPFGSRMLAADLNRDGYDDLVVGAPGADRGPEGSGFVQVVFGGPHGFRDPPRDIVRTGDLEPLGHFGNALRAGDINGDGNIDLVEGAPDEPGVSGHATYCRGTRKGPATCVPLVGPRSSGTSGLAVADVNGDGFDDIIQGDAVVERFDTAAGGEVRLWLGSRDGPRKAPFTLSQRRPWIPGDDEAGDEFGFSVAAGRLDDDRFADIVVGAPGEGRTTGAGIVSDVGAITVLRGAAETGHALQGHTAFARRHGIPGTPIPGERLGGSVVVMDIGGGPRPDVIFKAAGNRIEDSLFVIQAGPAVFAPGEARVWRPLRGGVAIENPQIDETRIGRGSGA
jgi:predicted Ser/Thr protein kinase